jgi:hypothetical protein
LTRTPPHPFPTNIVSELLLCSALLVADVLLALRPAAVLLCGGTTCRWGAFLLVILSALKYRMGAAERGGGEGGGFGGKGGKV